MFDPTVGRWFEEDPAGLDVSDNLYEYVGNSPTNATDPSGHLLITSDKELADKLAKSLVESGADKDRVKVIPIVGGQFYVHTDERDRLALFKYANGMASGTGTALGPRERFLLASGAVGEVNARHYILTPVNVEKKEFKEQAPSIFSLVMALKARTDMMAGYDVKPLVLDVGGEGRHFDEGVGVISVNPSKTIQSTTKLPSLSAAQQAKCDVPIDPKTGRVTALPLWFFGDANKLSPMILADPDKKLTGPFLPHSVDVVMVERSLGWFNTTAFYDGLVTILKPGGRVILTDTGNVGPDFYQKLKNAYERAYPNQDAADMIKINPPVPASGKLPRPEMPTVLDYATDKQKLYTWEFRVGTAPTGGTSVAPLPH